MGEPEGISPSVIIANSRAVARIAGLGFLPEARLKRPSLSAPDGGAAAVLAWGRKPSAVKAQALAERLGLPLLRLEDGFLRSIGLGADEPPLSIVVDDLGVYYDATAPSRLERLAARPHSEDQRARASRLVHAWRAARVSKYNHARELAPRGKKAEIFSRPFVLAADQTRGDASIQYGLADESSFQRMLQAALDENPGHLVLLKVHPAVMAGSKRGHFDLAALGRNPRVVVLGQDVHPVSLIERAQAVYVVTSQIGFEGLLWGRRVRTFGMPFYAGWGLTGDELAAPERRSTVGLEDLVYAALIEYPRYRDPETDSRCEVERVIGWMGLQRRMRERFPTRVYALGFSPWKKPIVRTFFQGSSVTFVRSPARIPPRSTLVVWGRKQATAPPRAAAQDTQILRLEDGFLRSVGLGADLVRPLSWIADGRGMYYDATGPSDLEYLLQTMAFDAALVARARSLRERIVASGLTKYNVNDGTWQRPAKRRVLLVPGQVESDASIRFGAPGIRTNVDLVRTVRESNPDAYVVYKPHPDVVAKLRKQGTGEEKADRWCDEVAIGVSMDRMLGNVDEVHVLTSLAGFEALLRSKHVVTYGQPFYAGWGLTDDRVLIARRDRKLSLDELTAGVLIEYPVYISMITNRYTSPERTLDELLAWRARGDGSSLWWRRGLRLVLGFWDKWR